MPKLTEFQKRRIEQMLTEFQFVSQENFTAGEMTDSLVKNKSTTTFDNRIFVIEHTRWKFSDEDETYFPYEIHPVGTMLVDGEQVNLKTKYEESPSEFSEFLAKQNIDFDSLELVHGVPKGEWELPNNLPDRDAAVNVVIDAIENNSLIISHHSHDEDNPHRPTSKDYKKLLSLVGKMSDLERFKGGEIKHNKPPSLFDDKVLFDGEPMSKESKDAIIEFMERPTKENWKNAGDCMISPTETLYNAIYEPQKISPINWMADFENNIPTPTAVEHALLTAVETNNKKCEFMVKTLTEEIAALEEELKIEIRDGQAKRTHLKLVD